MKITYNPILDLHLWHDYCLGQLSHFAGLPSDYDISSIIQIIPTSDCLATLRRLRWLARLQPWGITILAEGTKEGMQGAQGLLSDGESRSKIPITQPHRLTFWLEISDRAFAN
ncbi:MAG: hypothetical protein F6K09_37575, partial [Merismopedia sp. SIO2A8]|nr:hypothetical protein [Merismopedia sp. SIO2A8]